ncbi:uncharacterized protein V6R79_001956 [Siganus canaliculatus]
MKRQQLEMQTAHEHIKRSAFLLQQQEAATQRFSRFLIPVNVNSGSLWKGRSAAATFSQKMTTKVKITAPSQSGFKAATLLHRSDLLWVCVEAAVIADPNHSCIAAGCRSSSRNAQRPQTQHGSSLHRCSLTTQQQLARPSMEQKMSRCFPLLQRDEQGTSRGRAGEELGTFHCLASVPFVVHGSCIVSLAAQCPDSC